MRTSFKEAGVVKNLFRLLDYDNEPIRLGGFQLGGISFFLIKLFLSKFTSIVSFISTFLLCKCSNDVCQKIQAEGVLKSLIRSLKNSDASESSTHMILNILGRILDPSKEMKSKVSIL
ncbi:hypothetical protein Hanom_Chr12g01082801 [Helianthus anomalus]